MTAFTNTSPAANEVLSVSQGKMLDNFNYTYLTLGVDHSVTANTGVAQNGYHKVIRYVDQLLAPATIAGTGQLYTKTISGDQQLFYKTGGGTEIQVTAGAGPSGINVVAAATFNNAGAAVFPFTNVASVAATPTGYAITFAGGGLGSADYYVAASVRPALLPLVVTQDPGNANTATIAYLSVWQNTSNLLSTAFTYVQIVVFK